jgi:uncharacterized protein YecE (DUF72 family)
MPARFVPGTSGYSYDHWRGVFYPPGLPAAGRLGFYASAFPAVELNVTFYRLPDRDVFVSWRDETPPGFRFVVKGSRLITHSHRLHDADDAVRTLFSHAAGLRGKLEAFLWQLPPNMRADPGRLDAFCALVSNTAPTFAGAPAPRHAFEFRHESWLTEETYAVLRSHGAVLVIPDRAGSPPAPRVLTSGATYLRFHAGVGAGGGYTDAQLGEWAERARAWLTQGTDVYAFFNNDPAGHAVADARRLSDLVEGTKTGNAADPPSSAGHVAGPRADLLDGSDRE